MLDNMLIFASVLAVFVGAGTEAAKKIFTLKKNLVPAVGVGIGLLLGASAFPLTDLDIGVRLWSGFVAGLAATGFYEFALNQRDGTTKPKK